jgi:peptide subunit release factor RF-3
MKIVIRSRRNVDTKHPTHFACMVRKYPPGTFKIYLAASEWRLGFIMEEWPDIAFRKTREHG